MPATWLGARNRLQLPARRCVDDEADGVHRNNPNASKLQVGRARLGSWNRLANSESYWPELGKELSVGVTCAANLKFLSPRGEFVLKLQKPH